MPIFQLELNLRKQKIIRWRQVRWDGEWFNVVIFFRVKNCYTKAEKWDGALSCRKEKSCDAKRADLTRCILWSDPFFYSTRHLLHSSFTNFLCITPHWSTKMNNIVLMRDFFKNHSYKSFAALTKFQSPALKQNFIAICYYICTSILRFVTHYLKHCLHKPLVLRVIDHTKLKLHTEIH